MDFAVNDAVLFQLAKLLGQHAFADGGDFSPQLSEPVNFISQPEQDEDFPFAPNHVQSSFHGAVILTSPIRCLCRHTYHNVSITSFSAYLP